jgi:hypothetical protein
VSPRALALPLLAAALLYAGVVASQTRLDAARRAMAPPGEELLYLPNERLLTHFTAGMSGVIADLLWIQCVQYTAAEAKGARNFTWLNHMVNTVVRLDPHFTDAYRYGGMFLAALKADDNASLDLLHRGMIMQPMAWELPYEAAMVYLLNRRDAPEGPKRAAIYLARSAATGKAPPFVADIAAQLQGEYNLLDVEEQMWRNILRSPDALLHDLALEKLRELERRRATGAGGKAVHESSVSQRE